MATRRAAACARPSSSHGANDTDALEERTSRPRPVTQRLLCSSHRVCACAADRWQSRAKLAQSRHYAARTRERRQLRPRHRSRSGLRLYHPSTLRSRASVGSLPWGGKACRTCRSPHTTVSRCHVFSRFRREPPTHPGCAKVRFRVLYHRATPLVAHDRQSPEIAPRYYYLRAASCRHLPHLYLCDESLTSTGAQRR